MQKVWIALSLAVLAGLGYWLYISNAVKKPEVATVVEDTTDTLVTDGKKKSKKKKPFVNLHIDSLALHKANRTLFAFSKQNVVLQYRVALGPIPEGHKEIEGDYRTPEGWYYIDGKNPASHYHKSLGISYPNARDRAHAAEIGFAPGGDIKIHGLMKNMNNTGKNHIKSDWTLGCIAITNEEIDELYAQVKVGTPIFITP